MNERTIQIMLAITILFVGIFFELGTILALIGISWQMISFASSIISLIIFLFAISTAVVLISDALKKD